ncbi:MAG: DUF2892 domain-containing protein [Halovenus sp.]|uniref:YgaP family membrane protein n=1 Tax=Halovenus amylolytica TaxID=2500550 RepID=UPI000FE32C4A
MEVEQNVGGTDRIVRAVLATILAVVAILALRKGKRSAGVLATLGAIGFGINAVTCFCGLNETLGIDTTAEE